MRSSGVSNYILVLLTFKECAYFTNVYAFIHIYRIRLQLYCIFREFDELEDSTIPEIQRSNLTSVILTMMNIGVENVQNFDFMDAPGTEDIISAVR